MEYVQHMSGHKYTKEKKGKEMKGKETSPLNPLSRKRERGKGGRLKMRLAF